MRRLLLAPAAACALLVGCRSAPPPYSEAHESVWAYLEARYDGDRDGAVSRREYGRGKAAFERLDRDGDGKVTAADFEEPAEMDRYIARMSLMKYFQDDGDPMELRIGELGAAHGRHDGDGDGEIDEAEFACAAAAMEQDPSAGPPMPPGMKPYGSILAAVDRDRSGTLSKPELEAFHRAVGDWKMEGSGDRKEAPPPPPDPSPRPGDPAPDFTLRPPGGGRPLTLSSFRGRRPVALIFGSYT
jgi:Ca2+-binding EF-hand superfamily protein